MPQSYRRALVVVLCALVCTATAIVSARFPVGDTRTEDLNRDGRPDVWRSYGRDGRIATVAVDTNFDGRSDVQEFYQDGALIRRESDRDFNDRIDLIQDFDPETRQIVRSVTDVDADGIGDLLVLFQDGRPVYSKWADAITKVAAREPVASKDFVRTADEPLGRLVDPFGSDRAVKPLRLTSSPDDSLGPLPTVGALTSISQVAGPASSSSKPAFDRRAVSSLHANSVSLRGPPASLLSLS